MDRCASCGAAVDREDLFCRTCGRSIVHAEVVLEGRIDAGPTSLPPPPGAPPPPEPRASWVGVGPAAGLPPLDPPYQSLDGIAGAARLLLVLCAIVASGSLIADVAQYVFVDQWLNDPGDPTALDRVSVSDLWQALLTLLIVLALIPTAVAFLMWLQRAYANLPALGMGERRYSPGWVIGCWFLPVLNFVWPKVIVDATWRDSDPDAPDLVALPDARGRVPLAIHVWWGCFVAMIVFWAISAYIISGDVIRPTQERMGYAFEILSSAAAVAAAVLAYGLVGNITDRQRARAVAVGIDLDTGFREVPPVVQPVVDQRPVPGFPPPPSVPPVPTRADPRDWWELPSEPPTGGPQPWSR